MPRSAIVRAAEASGSSSGLTPPASAAVALRLPPFVGARLLPFQRESVRFAVARGGRAILGDDMGLGKTVQAAAVVAHYARLHHESAAPSPWPLLVVCPSSVKYNWRAELARWLPELLRVAPRASGAKRKGRGGGTASSDAQGLLTSH